MPSTPKNPLDGGGSIQGAPNMVIAPKVPPYDGGQFARDSMTPPEITINRDQYWNEIPSDRPYHNESSAMTTSPGDYTADLQGQRNAVNYGGRQFDTIVRSPQGNQYGAATTDLGQSPGKSQVSVNPNSADRGKDS